MAVVRATAPLLLASVTSGRQLETISRLRSRVLESSLDERAASPDLEIEIGNSETESKKCVTVDKPVCCASDAGDPDNRLNDRDQPYEDEFWISHENDFKTVCAETYVEDATWGMLLKVQCKEGNSCAGVQCNGGEACDCTDGQCKRFGKEYHITKDVMINDAVSAEDEAAFEKYVAENQPDKHWTKSDKFYHDSLDEHNNFQHTEVSAQGDLGRVDILIGKSLDSGKKCVRPTVPVKCDTTAADPTKRIDPNGDQTMEVFAISVSDQGREVCAEAANGWKSSLEIQCAVQNPCEPASCSENEMCDRSDGACKPFPEERIPKRIIFTGAVIPEQVVERNRRFADAGTEFRYYNDAQMEKSVAEISKQLADHGVRGANAAWHKLRAMAFRADLWRYMILWSEGGTYLDHKLMLNAPLSSIVNRSKNHVHTVIDLEATEMDGSMNIYWNAVISAPKGDLGLLQAIKESIESIQKADYDFGEHFNVLYFTGPGRLGRSLKHSGCEIGLIGKFEKIDPDDEESPSAVLNENRQPVIVPDEAAHDASMGSSYARLYNSHAVFCDEPMPPHLAAMHDPCGDEVANLQVIGEPFWSTTI